VRKRFGVLAAIGGICTLIGFTATPAFAGSITAPLCGTAICGPSTPYQALTDVSAAGVGTPRFFSITGSGYTPQSTNVFIEICDGVPPTTTGYDPSLDCDIGTSPAAALSDVNGLVSFPAGNLNLQLHLFDGASPSVTFNCLRADETALANGVTSYGIPGTADCQIRMSTNNTITTGTESYMSFALVKVPPVPEAPYAILLPAGALLLFGGGYVVTRRRRSSQAAA
jgi:hypothetical protein